MSHIKLYKYRATSGSGLLYILDAIVNNRIYLSNCDAMNDPEEGSWDNCEDQPTLIKSNYLEAARSLRQIVDSTRFTSFTKECTNPLLWAHYAGGFSGIVFEYEFDQSEYDIRPIEYKGKVKLTLDKILDVVNRVRMPQDIGILMRKNMCWAYEQEYRLFNSNTSDGMYIKNKPTRVIFGVRKSNEDDILLQIVRKYNIKVGYLIQREDKFYVFNIDD